MERMAEISQPFSPHRTMLGRIERSVEKHSTLWVCFLLLAGFVVRVWRAYGTFLNPDEAMHFQAANQTSWDLAYRASLTLAHPPLLVLFLHAWRWLGTSEVVLRLPSVVAGTVFCWLAYKWASVLFPPAVAWITFTLTIFLPSTIDLSSEVRQYALMLAFAMASAYLLERALKTDSVAVMLGSGLTLWLALGFHYSAFLFAAAIGAYALVRMLERPPSVGVVVVWGVAQALGIGLGYFFYVTQLSKLNAGDAGSGRVYEWLSAYLPNSYFVPGKINPLLFIFARTGGVFQYAFGQAVVGDAAYLLFMAGIILVLRKRSDAQISTRQLSLLLILPFVVNCGAALAAAYPYGGTRHSAFLLPFALAGVALTLAHVLRYRVAAGISVALMVALFCNLFASHRQPYMSRQDHSVAHMRDALAFIRGQIPPEDTIFTDHQGSLMLRHYLCEQRPITINLQVPGFRSYECGGHRVVTPETAVGFTFTPRSFSDRWQAFVLNYKLPPGTSVWVAQIGWNTQLATELEAFREFHLSPHSFGGHIQFFDLTVGQAMPDPKLLPAS